MLEQGYDPEVEDDRRRFALTVQKKYFEKVNEAAHCVNPEWPVFHNDGGSLLEPGHEEFQKYYSHFELESLPTGGWGYDHFPLLAAYCRTQSVDFLGMTGGYHSTWGEYGGFKHPNALRYECAAMIAQGAKCSVGGDLHPSGRLDESFCRIVGEAYKEVEEKEPWCRGAIGGANVALLSNSGFNHPLEAEKTSEIGVSRLLQEAHIPFDRLGEDGAFEAYKVLILADDLRPDASLRSRLEDFLKQGGKLILSGFSLLKKECDEPAFNLPLQYCGPEPLFPNYVACAEEFAPECVVTPMVMYRQPLRIKVAAGARSLGKIHEPYYVRSYRHFCSHLHTPAMPEPSEYDGGVLTENILCFAHPVFLQYALYGHVILKEFVVKAIRALLQGDLQVVTTLPSQGRVSLLKQPYERRYILHALYANTILRGMAHPALSTEHFATSPKEVIEDLNPLFDVNFSVRLPEKITRITLEPQGNDLPFTQDSDGRYLIKLEKLQCHQMIVFHY